MSGALAGSVTLESIAQSEDYGDQQHGEHSLPDVSAGSSCTMGILEPKLPGCLNKGSNRSMAQVCNVAA